MTNSITAVVRAMQEVLDLLFGTETQEAMDDVYRVLAEESQPLTPWSVEG